MPDDHLKEAVVGLWYNASVPKPNIKVIFIQTTLVLLADCLWHPYGIPQPLPNPVTDVIGRVHFLGEEERLCVLDGMTMVVIHPTLLGSALGHWGVRGLTLIVPL